MQKIKFSLFVLLLLMGCESSNKVKDLIQGNWYFENGSNVYIKIKHGRWTVENDSPYPEDYTIIGDTVVLVDAHSFKIVKLTEDTLVLKEKNDTLTLFKK